MADCTSGHVYGPWVAAADTGDGVARAARTCERCGHHQHRGSPRRLTVRVPMTDLLHREGVA